MNGLLTAAGILASLFALGHAFGGHKPVLLSMTAADFDPLARRTMVFVWHLSTLVLFMIAAALLHAATSSNGRELAWYVLIQLLGLAAIHLGTAATSRIPRWYLKMPQWVVFATIAGLTAGGLAPV